MKVYLAAPYAARDSIRDKAAQLKRIGFTVTSTWLQETHEINAGTVGPALALNPSETESHVRTDVKDVLGSDLLVVFTNDTAGVASSSGGRHVETGIAMSKGIPVVVVGQPENIFHRSTYCLVVPTWEEALVELAARLIASIRGPRPHFPLVG